MIIEYMKDNDMTNYGCVVLLENEPHLFILDDDQETLHCVLLDDVEETYTYIEKNEMVLVVLNIIYASNYIEPEFIETDICEELIFNINPLSIVSINKKDTDFDNILDMGIFTEFFTKKLDDYIQSKVV